MQDFNELQQAKAACLKDITEALPRYSERLAAIDQRLTEYVEDAVSGNASHARSTSGRLPLGFLALASVSYRRRAAEREITDDKPSAIMLE